MLSVVVNEICASLSSHRYLGAFAAAEMLWQAVFQWKQIGSLDITATSLAFFKDVYPDASIGTFAASSAEFDKIIEAVSEYADSYMANAVSIVPKQPSHRAL